MGVCMVRIILEKLTFSILWTELRARIVSEVSAYWSCVQFSGYVEMKVSQTYKLPKSWQCPCLV